MSDRKLLECAAKAIGLDVYFATKESFICTKGPDFVEEWNPLTNSSDAMSLARMLPMTVSFEEGVIVFKNRAGTCFEIGFDTSSDEYTRRAITTAAAIIGEEK